MTASTRHNTTIKGNGTRAMMFVHGYGCDQNMWRYITPSFENDFKIILLDHVGARGSDLAAYSYEKYSTLEGYADDIIELAEELKLKEIIFVGHSVSALIGIIASVKVPKLFKSLILVGPSPSYINDGDYIGGFTREQIDELLEALDNNHLGWSMSIAPVIMGNPERKELSEELANSFCRMDPAIAKQFARTTFLSDKREILPQVTVPSLILQCSNDVIAPEQVGEYMNKYLADSKLVLMKATGHCPNLSAPEETIHVIKEYVS